MTQLAYLSLQSLDPLLGRGAVALTPVAFGIPNPLAQRFSGEADPCCDQGDDCPLRGVLALMVRDHPHRTGENLRRIKRVTSCHDSIPQGRDITGKPSRVHIAIQFARQLSLGVKPRATSGNAS